MATLDELQAALDIFCAYYNRERPHRGIGRVTPWDRWHASPRVANPGAPLPDPPRRTRGRVTTEGVVWNRPYGIGVGVEYAGRPSDVLVHDGYANVFIDGLLVRHLQLDPTRTYQPTGRGVGAPGRPRRRRQP